MCSLINDDLYDLFSSAIATHNLKVQKLIVKSTEVFFVDAYLHHIALQESKGALGRVHVGRLLSQIIM